MSDSSNQMLENLRTLLVEVGRLQASTDILKGLTKLAAEYSASQKVNAVLPEADEAEQRVVDAYWAGVRYGIQESVKAVDLGMPNHTEKPEKSKKED